MAANPVNVQMRLDGANELKRLCDELPRNVVERGLKKAANAGGTPVTKAYRSMIDSRSGTLKKAIKKKVKLYRDKEVAIALIGVDKNVIGSYDGKKVWPFKYQHLLEIGVKPHAIRRGNVVIQHPGIQGQHYLQHAEQAAASAGLAAAESKLKESLESEAAKLAK